MPLKCRAYCKSPENTPFGANPLAGGLGFEPRQAESESAVLPLDDPPITRGTARLDQQGPAFKDSETPRKSAFCEGRQTTPHQPGPHASFTADLRPEAPLHGNPPRKNKGSMPQTGE